MRLPNFLTWPRFRTLPKFLASPSFFVLPMTAVGRWRDTGAWRALQRNGMSRDFSWTRAAKAYEELYRQII